MAKPIQHLLSLPPAMTRDFFTLENRDPAQWFSAADPAGAKLGSGGGIAHLLTQAWRGLQPDADFSQWLRASQKLVMLAGGQSRRLPAYAAVSKILLPFKVLPWSAGQRLDQTLLDLQAPDYERVLQHAPELFRAMISSGDVLLRFGETLPPFPEVDILGLGMWVKPEVAKDFGVFFSRRETPEQLAFFLQKPAPETIREFAGNYSYLVDTGMWLLSERAVATLLRRCGWDEKRAKFANDDPDFYELYADLGLALGAEAQKYDPEINALTCGVAALPEAEFYHLGTSRQLIEAMSAIEDKQWERRRPGAQGPQPHPDQHVQNALLDLPMRRQENHTLWVENSVVPKTWELACEHVITNVPKNRWTLKLERGECLDFIAVREHDFCIRAYHIDDAFKGALANSATRWMNRPAVEWFANRDLALEEIGLDSAADIQQSAIFPVLPLEKISGEFLTWLLAKSPAADSANRDLWLATPRLSAQEICEQANIPRLYAQRRENFSNALSRMVQNHRWNIFFQLDLQATAKSYAAACDALPPPLAAESTAPMDRVHDQMFRAAVLRLRDDEAWKAHETSAFSALREIIISETQLDRAAPRRNILDDQIIWGRSPVRLDLAGGWSDTPPYCLENGGRVLNLAVNLNGQPPIQVFAKLSEQPGIVLRSIDLGVEKQLRTFEEIENFNNPSDPFSLAKAALALAGFLPNFHATGEFSTLEKQLQKFGGGIELSLLCAVPKGSGLGTSSILSATMLGVLSELCGLAWDKPAISKRTLALEQMLTTGGGWQDQIGGLHRGVKLVETAPGLDQTATLRWLPEHLFSSESGRRRILLYYTGITRMAKNILQEIVRGMFLNSAAHLESISAIKANADAAFHAIQTSDWNALCQSVRQSWTLNCQLDSGTNPPTVQEILSRIEPHTAGAKLLGAGGGGYLLIFANDELAAQKIRDTLTANPLNSKARFVEIEISPHGLQITRS